SCLRSREPADSHSESRFRAACPLDGRMSSRSLADAGKRSSARRRARRPGEKPQGKMRMRRLASPAGPEELRAIGACILLEPEFGHFSRVHREPSVVAPNRMPQFMKPVTTGGTEAHGPKQHHAA